MAPFEKVPEDQSVKPEGEKTSPEETPAILPKAPETLDVKMDERKKGESIEYQEPAKTALENQEPQTVETPAESETQVTTEKEEKSKGFFETIKGWFSGSSEKEEEK